jgi:hypothetical protein
VFKKFVNNTHEKDMIQQSIEKKGHEKGLMVT